MKFTPSLLYSTLALLAVSCNSPLLNHRDAPLTRNLNGNEKTACTLALPKARLCASIEWTRMPTDSDKGEFTLRFWDAEQSSESGPYVDPAQTVFVKLWMPSMGHGSSPVTTAPSKDAGGLAIPGVYSVTEVFFVMPGAWQVIVQLKQNGLVFDQAALDVEI